MTKRVLWDHTMVKRWADIRRELIGEPTHGDSGMRKNRAVLSEDVTADTVVSHDTVFDSIRHYLSLARVKHAFRLGTDLFGAATPFIEKPTWWNAAKSAFGMGKVLVDDVEVYSDDYFSGDEWTQPYSTDFNQTMLNVLQKYPYERIKTAEDNTLIYIVTMPNGVRAGWSYSTKTQIVDNIYVETSQLNEARQCIKQLLWDQYKSKSLIMRKNNRMSMNGEDARVVFEIDDTFEPKLSKLAREYAAYLKKPLDAGVPRSVMFYGPPGTGKSTTARTIVDLMNLRSFRIRIADLGNIETSTLFEALSIFQPDAVILDDFDRTHNQAQLLETLEYFQRQVKLVLVTVNNKNSLDDALLRPGRIDELVLVDRMDEEIVKHVLGEYADGYDTVKEWPISYVHEYVTRRRYLSAQDAAEGVKELTRRVAELYKYRETDDDGFERMVNLIRTVPAPLRGVVAQTIMNQAGGAPAPQSHALSPEESPVTPDALKGSYDMADEFDNRVGGGD